MRRRGNDMAPADAGVLKWLRNGRIDAGKLLRTERQRAGCSPKRLRTLNGAAAALAVLY